MKEVEDQQGEGKSSSETSEDVDGVGRPSLLLGFANLTTMEVGLDESDEEERAGDTKEFSSTSQLAGLSKWFHLL